MGLLSRDWEQQWLQPQVQAVEFNPLFPRAFFPWVCSNPTLLQKITPESLRAMFERQLCARFLFPDTFQATNLKLLRKEEMVLCGLGYGVLASMVLGSWLLAQGTEPC